VLLPFLGRIRKIKQRFKSFHLLTCLTTAECQLHTGTTTKNKIKYNNRKKTHVSIYRRRTNKLVAKAEQSTNLVKNFNALTDCIGSRNT
jgi:hypothetical protein